MQITVVAFSSDVVKFQTGQLMATPNALSAISQEELVESLARHLKGDWGDVCPEDASANNCALITGDRLLSVYHTDAGARFWILTEADRSFTTVLLPEEY